MAEYALKRQMIIIYFNQKPNKTVCIIGNTSHNRDVTSRPALRRFVTLKEFCPRKQISVHFGTCVLNCDEKNNAIDIAKRVS